MELINILKFYFKNIKYDNILDINKLQEDSKRHAIIPLIYNTCNNELLFNLYIKWLSIEGVINNLLNELINLFNDYKIKHILLKGEIIKKYYPNESDRQRSDIDIFIDYNDILKIKEILLKNNYILAKEKMTSRHLTFIKNNIEIELHYKLFDKSDDKIIYEFFNDPFKNSLNIENYTYKIEDTYHLIYQICHFKHHLINGAGIRYIIDFYYMIKNSKIDFNLLNELIKKLKLEILFNNILNAIYYLTDEKLLNIEIIDINFFINYLYISGLHGLKRRHKNKFKYFISILFLTDKELRYNLYPKMSKYKILYPIIFIRHLFYLITHKFMSFINLFKGNNKKLFKKLGI